MNLDVLKTELTDDPLSRGYAGMTDSEAAADLNTAYREHNRTSMTGSEVINAVDTTEWASLTSDQKQTVWNVVHIGEINPFGVEAHLLIAVFGSGSATITKLATARKEAISRGVELGLGRVRVGHVQEARK